MCKYCKFDNTDFRKFDKTTGKFDKSAAELLLCDDMDAGVLGCIPVEGCITQDGRGQIALKIFINGDCNAVVSKKIKYCPMCGRPL